MNTLRDSDKEFGWQIEDIFRQDPRPSMLPIDAIPELSAGIARARDLSRPEESALRARADQILAQLAGLYSARSLLR